MKTFAPVLLGLLLFSCASVHRQEPNRLDYRRTSGRGPNGYQMMLNGIGYSELKAFTNAVEKLPRGSRLVLRTGCLYFPTIPLGPEPQMSMASFQEFCRNRRIRFEYYFGPSADPLITKSYAVPRRIATTRTDAREWLKANGVTFPEGTFAHWQPSKDRLWVRNTEENIDLVELLIQAETRNPMSTLRHGDVDETSAIP